MGTSFRPNQEKALVALLEHRKVARAARAAGLARQTLHEFKREPAFRAELERRRRAALEADDAVEGVLTGASVGPTLFERFKDRRRLTALAKWLKLPRAEVARRALQRGLDVLERESATAAGKATQTADPC